MLIFQDNLCDQENYSDDVKVTLSVKNYWNRDDDGFDNMVSILIFMILTITRNFFSAGKDLDRESLKTLNLEAALAPGLYIFLFCLKG